MERYRLKNIIILILALLNSFLLATLISRESEERSLLRRTEEELVELFAASGVTLDADAISWDTPPAGITLGRSEALERTAAKFLLGEDLQSAAQGGVSSYSGARGAAQFRAGGSFEAAGTLAGEDGADFCRKFCRQFSYSDPVFTLDEDGTGTAAAVLQYEKYSVYNAFVTFRLEKGCVTGVSGTLLPTEGGTAVSSGQLLSAAAALTAFQQMRQEESTVASSILKTSLCYELQSTSSAISLGSAWCIMTDIARYYVNCSTGAITVA